MLSSSQLENAHKANHYSSSFELGLMEKSATLLLSQLQGNQILELGCGLGIITRRLASNPHHTITVVETSSYFLDQAKQKVKKHNNINWVQQSWENFKPDSAYTDIVFFRGLDCVENIDQMMQSLTSLAGNSAHIHIVITNTQSFHRIVGERLRIDNVNTLTDRAHEVGRLQPLHDANMRAYVEKYHLHVLHAEGIGFKMFPNAKMDTFETEIREVFLGMGDVCRLHAVELYYKVQCK